MLRLRNSSSPELRKIYRHLRSWVANALIDDKLVGDKQARTTKPLGAVFGAKKCQLLIGEDYINNMDRKVVGAMIQLAATLVHESVHKWQFTGLRYIGYAALTITTITESRARKKGKWATTILTNEFNNQ